MNGDDQKKMVEEEAKRLGVPPDIAVKVAATESNFNPNAVSPKGAQGTMQLMPDTAKDLGVDPNDPRANITGGLTYLKKMYEQFGDWHKALMAYNAGPGRTQKVIEGKATEPEETKRYTEKIEGTMPEDVGQQQPDTMRIQGPDGQIYPFPKGTTKEQAIAFFRSMPQKPAGQMPPPAGQAPPPTGQAPPPPGQVPPPPGQTPPPPGAKPPAPFSAASGVPDYAKNLAIGAGRGLAQTGSDLTGLASMLPGAGGLKKTKFYDMLTAMAVPENDAQRIGKFLEQSAEFLVPIAGEEDMAMKMARYAPEIKAAVETVSKTATGVSKIGKVAQYEKGLAGATRLGLQATKTGAIQGAHVAGQTGSLSEGAKYGAYAAGASVLTDGIIMGSSKLSSGVLDKVLRIEPVRSEAGVTGKLLQNIPGLRRAKIYANSIKALGENDGNIARELQQTSMRRVKVDVGAYLNDLETLAKDPATSRDSMKAIKAMAEDVRKLGGTITSVEEKSLINKSLALQKQIATQKAALNFQSGITMGRTNAVITRLESEVKAIQRQIADSRQVYVTPSQLNRLRNVIGKDHVTWGVLQDSMSTDEKAAMDLYKRIEKDVIANSPSQSKMQMLLKDERGLRDIMSSTEKKPSTGFGVHTLTPGNVMHAAMPFLGWELGRKYGGVVGGMAGAAGATAAYTPGLVAAAKTIPKVPRLGMAGALVAARPEAPKKSKAVEHTME